MMINFILLSEFVEQRKITKIFRETEKWLNILEVGECWGFK